MRILMGYICLVVRFLLVHHMRVALLHLHFIAHLHVERTRAVHHRGGFALDTEAAVLHPQIIRRRAWTRRLETRRGSSRGGYKVLIVRIIRPPLHLPEVVRSESILQHQREHNLVTGGIHTVLPFVASRRSNCLGWPFWLWL